ncbi:hypothetical protein SEA_SATIS_306 [Streptomyces phage Satis]|nr:hypothetical protein SEA_SATIS_306 [Streptomyces phage Satis]QBZ72192.1 hypothetical protein SEA_KRADAL_306 [Streptomyces phage Kradal]QPL14614.1 hypothetical protein SEA_EHYELIMAYOE_309 [Streptomyces phage EhyElimayoE]
MADNGLCDQHKNRACGICRHPKMAKTRAHVRNTPLPKQKKGNGE